MNVKGLTLWNHLKWSIINLSNLVDDRKGGILTLSMETILRFNPLPAQHNPSSNFSNPIHTRNNLNNLAAAVPSTETYFMYPCRPFKMEPAISVLFSKLSGFSCRKAATTVPFFCSQSIVMRFKALYIFRLREGKDAASFDKS